MTGPTDDRRTSHRVEAIVLVQLDKDGRHGVTRDMSESGLLIATPCSFSVGDRLGITIRSPSGSIEANARVVRVDATPPQEPWRYRIGLELDSPVPRDVVEDGARVAATLLRRASSIPPRA